MANDGTVRAANKAADSKRFFIELSPPTMGIKNFFGALVRPVRLNAFFVIPDIEALTRTGLNWR
jgi:hypothetical protein